MTATTTTNDVPKITETLQAKWYNTIAAALGQSPGQFQLLQPTAPLGTASDSLWSYFNTIPPESLTNNFNAGGGNLFYDDYRGVVSRLVSQGTDNFKRDLGDSYDDWMAYVKTLNPIPTVAEMPEKFRSWASVYAPDIAQQGATDLANLQNDPIYRATLAVQDQKNFKNGVPNFSQAIADLTGSLQRAEQRSFSFDSESASGDTTNTWAKGGVSGFWDIFSGKASTEYSHLTQTLTSSSLSITGSFEHALTFAANPGSWYSSAALGAAYRTQDNTLWSHGTPNWNSTFGPTGNMRFFTSSLVVVDGIEATITSSATYSTEDQETVKANLEVGIFPFFGLDASGGYSSNATFDDKGRMTVKVSNPAGNPVVFGVNVLPAAKFLG